MPKRTFFQELVSEINANIKNNYQDNYDFYRFGKEKRSLLDYGLGDFSKTIKSNKLLRYIFGKPPLLSPEFFLEPYKDRFEYLYEIFSDEQSRMLLVKIMAYRILGYKKVKLPLNTDAYWDGIKTIEELADKTDYFQISYKNKNLYRIDLASLDIPVSLYYGPKGTYTQFVLQQYACELENGFIKAEPGEVVIDAGSCYGDSALYFANCVGKSGHVYSFEFIPQNISVMMKNLSLNPELSKQITIVQQPLWSESEILFNYKDNGPGSKLVVSGSFENAENKTRTVTIDDLVMQNDITRLDFIKMDIEGAELKALQGAKETLIKHKPKLAISVYHQLSDFVDIPEFISSLGLGYSFYLRHATIHKEETVLFAQV